MSQPGPKSRCLRSVHRHARPSCTHPWLWVTSGRFGRTEHGERHSRLPNYLKGWDPIPIHDGVFCFQCPGIWPKRNMTEMTSGPRPTRSWMPHRKGTVRYTPALARFSRQGDCFLFCVCTAPGTTGPDWGATAVQIIILNNSQPLANIGGPSYS